MKLNTQQSKTLQKFLKEGMVIVDAPRRSGKTFLLQYIIEKFPQIRIGLFTLNAAMCRAIYGKLPSNVRYQDWDADILLGDEVIIQIRGKQCLSVGTFNLGGVDTWYIKEGDNHREIKKEMSKEAYHSEFGRYIK